MRHVLTDALIRTLAPPLNGRAELADMRSTGLSFRITSQGARSWNFRFRDPHSGKTTRATIGAYPDVSLARARDAADRMRRQVASGDNPVTAKRLARRDASTKTFAALADRYLTEYAQRHKRSHADDDRNLRLHVLPVWGERRYESIRRADVIELLEGLVKAGTPILANRVQSLISGVFTFAVDAALIDSHPSARLKMRAPERVGRRVLSDDEIRLFWPRIVEVAVSRPVGLALRLMLLTGARPSETAGITRSELHGMERADRAAWILPESRVKNGRPHLVPLGRMARDTINDALSMISAGEEFLFPQKRGGAPITRFHLADAMKRLAGSFATGEGEAWRSSPAIPHDLRRTVATRLSSLGVTKQDRDAVLNHTPSDVGSRHYDLYEREREKLRALNTWDSALALILAPPRARLFRLPPHEVMPRHNRAAG